LRSSTGEGLIEKMKVALQLIRAAGLEQSEWKMSI
jgi:hypothetical protein